jgi:hypothetical protein
VQSAGRSYRTVARGCQPVCQRPCRSVIQRYGESMRNCGLKTLLIRHPPPCPPSLILQEFLSCVGRCHWSRCPLPCNKNVLVLWLPIGLSIFHSTSQAFVMSPHLFRFHSTTRMTVPSTASQRLYRRPYHRIPPPSSTLVIQPTHLTTSATIFTTPRTHLTILTNSTSSARKIKTYTKLRMQSHTNCAGVIC